MVYLNVQKIAWNIAHFNSVETVKINMSGNKLFAPGFNYYCKIENLPSLLALIDKNLSCRLNMLLIGVIELFQTTNGEFCLLFSTSLSYC